MQEDVGAAEALNFAQTRPGVEQHGEEWPPFRRTCTLETPELVSREPTLSAGRFPLPMDPWTRNCNALDVAKPGQEGAECRQVPIECCTHQWALRDLLALLPTRRTLPGPAIVEHEAAREIRATASLITQV